jgi:hypothetical protein
VSQLAPQRIVGVREDLPTGERVLWQGAPHWRSLALQAFHVRKVAIYFAVLIALQVWLRAADGIALSAAIGGATMLAIAAAGTVGLLAFLAWAASRTTIYAITNRRVFMRIGIALPVFFNLPFKGIESAAVRVNADGTGDIPMALEPGAHLAYLHLWPHARPWQVKRPEPMLRAIPNAQAVAAILSQALAGAAGVAPQWRPAPEQTQTPVDHAVPTSAR